MLIGRPVGGGDEFFIDFHYVGISLLRKGSEEFLCALVRSSFVLQMCVL